MKLSANLIRLYQSFGLRKTLDIIAESGYDGIDFNADLEEFRGDAHDKDFYVETRKYMESKGLIACQSHAPFDSSFDDEEQTKVRFGEIITSMRNSSYMGAEMIVVHPCVHLPYDVEGNPEKLFEINMDFYQRLIPYSEEYGIKIAIENINKANRHSVCSTAERLAKLYDELNNDAFVVCFDVGHQNIVGVDPADAIRVLGDRIKCLHVHDNSGTRDEHTCPYHGTIDWESVINAFIDINYKGDLSYESSRFMTNLPEELYADAMTYMAKVGRYIINRIEQGR